MKNRGVSEKTILTIKGLIRYKRSILIPADEGSKSRFSEIIKKVKGIAPLDIALRTDNLPFKMTVQAMLYIANIALTQKSYEATEIIIKRTLNYNISDDTIRKIVNFIGKIIYEYDCKNDEEILKNKDRLINNIEEKIDAVFYIETDGNFINLLKKGETGSTWHENKIGLIFNSNNIETRFSIDGSVQKTIKKREYISHFCPAEKFKKHLYALALKNFYYKYKKIVIVSDGASWIRNFKKEYFPESTHILDFYHLLDNAGKFAKYIFKNDERISSDAVERWANHLRNSEYKKVLDELEDYKDFKCPDGIVNLYKYIVNNIDSIDYKEYTNNNYIIGSGAIEGANKYVIQSRMKLSGMRWREDTSQYVATLRAKLCSELWDEVEKIVKSNFVKNYKN